MNEPAGQAEHPPAAAVPGRVTVPVKPGAHTEHAATEAAPATWPAVVTPYGHGEQPVAVVVPGKETMP